MKLYRMEKGMLEIDPCLGDRGCTGRIATFGALHMQPPHMSCVRDSLIRTYIYLDAAKTNNKHSIYFFI